MQIVAYLYQDISWEVPINVEVWGWEIDQVYQDFDPSRPQLQVVGATHTQRGAALWPAPHGSAH